MIEIKKLTKCYGKQGILSGTDFVFPDSGLICLLGASGCGKSTLLNMLAGFDSDYQGEIVVSGTSITKMGAADLCAYRGENIGFVFQNYNLLTGYTVLENVLLSRGASKEWTSKKREQAKMILDRLGISEKENERIENLSGGQKQRTAIARALVNHPSIILADEPTGALDRKNSTEIMRLLKKISKDRLVLVITHDQKICEFADTIVSIQDGQIIGELTENRAVTEMKLKRRQKENRSVFQLGLKNFKVHIKQYISVSLAIAVGVLAFMLSLSTGNMMEQSIKDFKEKNTAFNNGYIKTKDNIKDDTDKIFALLKEDKRIVTVYEQHIIKEVMLSMGGKSETMAEKYPMPKVTESMSYGSMPKTGQNKIALSPSLAKKFDSDIDQLIGKELSIKYDKTVYKLTISGIFNADYDDFFISSDMEQKLYQKQVGEKPYSISYDVKQFEDVIPVSQMLADRDAEVKTAAKEVGALQTTFQNLNRLFGIVSLLVMVVSLLISVILLVKMQNSRYKEIGLLSALGFSKSKIRAIMVTENLFLSGTAALFNLVLIGLCYLVRIVFKLNLIITVPQIMLSIFSTGAAMILIGIAASHKLIHTEPAVALRK